MPGPRARVAAPSARGPGRRLLRNRWRSRWLHAAVYLTTALLGYSGLAVGWGGRPGLEALLGGHAATGAWHRWAGYVLAGGLLLVAVVWVRAAVRFLTETVTFRRADLRWLASWPRAALRPRRHAPTRHEGHFDPGQRLLNVVLLAALLTLTVTGIIMAFPREFTPAAFGASLRVHRVATWVLLAAVAGHLLVASGILPGYRGTWRAMHRGGRVPADLARRLWPRWAEEQERAPEPRGKRPQRRPERQPAAADQEPNRGGSRAGREK